MLRSGGKKIAKQKFYAAKKPIKIWDVNIVISKLVKTKTNSKYLNGYLDKDIRPLVLIMPKISGYVKTFKVKEGDKHRSNKLMSFGIDDEKLLEKCKAIWTKIEDFKNMELNALTVYDDRYIKTKIRTDGDKIYSNFRGLNVLYYDRIGISEGIDLTKNDKSRECMICNYFFFNHGFKFQNYICNGCHD